MNKRTKDTLIMGFALFAMFLGAGNLIFPPFLGFHTGDAWIPVLIGFVLTGVGLPLLGVYSTMKSGGSTATLGRYVGKGFSIFMGVAIILAIGPCFAIPRTAATVHEVGVLPFFPGTSPVVTSVVFFGLALFFAISNTTVVDRIGRYLTPFLIITLFSIILAAIFNPIGSTAPVENAYNFAGGFTEGYQTLDALAATMFAGVVAANVVSRGYNKLEDQLSITIRCGIIAAALLAFVYGGLVYAGATSVSAGFPADIERTKLLTDITHGLLGPVGQTALSLAVSLACLTTAVALCVSCGQFFNTLSKGKFSYKAIVIATVIFSFAISVMGVTFIINAAAPVLFLMYPVLMILLVFMAFDNFIPNKNAYVGGVIGAFTISIIDFLTTLKAGFEFESAFIDSLAAFQAKLPLAGFGLSWVIPALVLAVVFSFIPRKRVDEEITELKLFKEGTK